VWSSGEWCLAGAGDASSLGRSETAGNYAASSSGGTDSDSRASEDTFQHTARTEDAMQSIMLATDGSPSAEDATREAIELARELDLSLTIVSVAHYTLQAFRYAYGHGELVSELRKIEQEHVDQVLATVRERADAAGVTSETVPLVGLPGHEICSAARERDIRLIVIGAHGWGRLGRMIHGSVSEWVLRNADVPVLVVSGDAPLQADAATEKVEAASSTP
jgi:nucleotide-binding universal stress UspA family protein